MTQQSVSASPGSTPARPEGRPAPQLLLDMYRRMSLIKQNDERFLSTIKAGKIVAPYYSPRGQEAIPSAVSVSLSNDDYICTIYRGFHDMLAKAFPSSCCGPKWRDAPPGPAKARAVPCTSRIPRPGSW